MVLDCKNLKKYLTLVLELCFSKKNYFYKDL